MAREISHQGRSPCECDSPVSHSFHSPCPPARATGPCSYTQSCHLLLCRAMGSHNGGGESCFPKGGQQSPAHLWRDSCMGSPYPRCAQKCGGNSATETATEAVISWPLPGEKRTRRETESIEIAAESVSFRETQGLVLLCCHCHPEATSQAAVWGILAVSHAASTFRSQSQRAHTFAHTLASNLMLLQTPAHYTGSAPTMLPDPSKQTSTWGGFVWSGHCHLRSWWPANINQYYGDNWCTLCRILSFSPFNLAASFSFIATT